MELFIARHYTVVSITLTWKRSSTKYIILYMHKVHSVWKSSTTKPTGIEFGALELNADFCESQVKANRSCSVAEFNTEMKWRFFELEIV